MRPPGSKEPPRRDGRGASCRGQAAVPSESRPVASRQGSRIQGRQFLLELQARYCPAAFLVQIRPKEHRAPSRRRHAQSKVRIERAYGVSDGDQSRRPSRQAIVVHHAIRGGAIAMDRGHRPRAGERLSQLAVSEASDEVQEGACRRREAVRRQEPTARRPSDPPPRATSWRSEAQCPRVGAMERQCQSGASAGSRWNQRDTYCVPDSTTVFFTCDPTPFGRRAIQRGSVEPAPLASTTKSAKSVASPAACRSAVRTPVTLSPSGLLSSPTTFWPSRTCTVDFPARPRRSTFSRRAREQAYVVIPEGVRGSQPAEKRNRASAEASKGRAPSATSSSLQPGINSSNAAAPAAISR